MSVDTDGRCPAGIRVLVAGPDGRMGSVMMAALPGQPGIEVVGGLRRDDPRRTELLAGADVLVDFTIADSAVELMLMAIAAGVRPVSGTSGVTPDDLRRVDEAARDRGIAAVWASHFSLSAALMTYCCRLAARHLDSATILETHHATKVDAPSGSSRELARRIRDARGSDLVDHPSRHETVPEVRGGLEGGVRLHSLRMPGLLGWTEVTFSGAGELLTIRQTDATRESFPPFVARAVHEVMATDRIGLINGFGDVVGLKDPVTGRR